MPSSPAAPFDPNSENLRQRTPSRSPSHSITARDSIPLQSLATRGLPSPGHLGELEPTSPSKQLHKSRSQHFLKMGKGGGLALKSIALFLYFIEFCCAAIILGIYAYFLAALSSNHITIPTYERAVTGISGSGVLYTIFALLLTCCLGGVAITSIIAMLLNLAFCGAFIYVAYATRDGAGSCTGFVNTPLGSGDVADRNKVKGARDGFVYLPSFKTTCRMNTACFAVAIIAAVFFFLSTILEIFLIKHHRKEKAFGPSPNNGYTAGTPRRKFWQRKPKTNNFAAEKPDALPAHTTPSAMRTSYATDATAVGHEPVYNKYGNTAPPVAHGGLGNTNPEAPAVYGGPNYGNQTTTTTHMPAGNYSSGANF